ncbi:MAG: hypothetical protein WC595_00170 [Candidatus Nanoarchaeia archaeon]
MSLENAVMTDWMSAVKRKIVELESSKKLIIRFVDFRQSKSYFTTGAGLIEKEAICTDRSFKELQESHFNVRKKETSLAWGSTAEYETDWEQNAIDSVVYYDVLDVYKEIKKEKNESKAKATIRDRLKISKRQLEKAILAYDRSNRKDYAEVLRRFGEDDFKISDGRFMDALAEAIAFLKSGRSVAWSAEYGTYSMIVYLNSSRISRDRSLSLKGDFYRDNWGDIQGRFTDDLIIGVQVLVPKKEQVRRVVWEMLEATENHPTVRAPVYDLRGKLVWPTKEELKG